VPSSGFYISKDASKKKKDSNLFAFLDQGKGRVHLLGGVWGGGGRGGGSIFWKMLALRYTSYKNLFKEFVFTKFFLLQDSVSRVKQTPHTVLGHRVQVKNVF
jgi:hypothetical protein